MRLDNDNDGRFIKSKIDQSLVTIVGDGKRNVAK